MIQRIKSLANLSDDEIAQIWQHFELRKIKKKTIVLRAGAKAGEVYFIISGCMRLYYEKEGNDISAYFFTENMFAGAYDSLVTQMPSMHSIETAEDCEVLILTYNTLQKMYVEIPGMNLLVRKIIEERFVALHQLYTSLILNSPEERYLQLLTHRPDLLTRIPQHQIATFLGVTPVSLSRIRNRVLRNRKS